MKKFLYACRKEVLLLIRDKAGLAMLFIMPMVLIIISSLMQEFGWDAIAKDPTIDVLFVNADHDSLGNRIEHAFEHSGNFRLTDSIGGRPLTAASAKEAVQRGDYMIAVVVPEGATRTMRNTVRLTVAKTLAGFGMGSAAMLDAIMPDDSLHIMLYFDPTVKRAFKQAVTSSIKEHYYRIQAEWVFSTFNQEMAVQMPMYNPPKEAFREIISFREEFPSYHEVEELPNTVQHNVPAWTIFAMFFIVIPMTQSLIKEREEGSLFRLLTMPVNYMTLLMAKVAVFMVVCYLQTVFMLLTGILLIPLFGLPMLDLGSDLFALVIMTLIVALAAVGYGLMVGTIARTHQQAAAFGSISVIIFAAMGGIWVPIYLMPDFMRTVSLVSPLNWGITGYYDIFLRGGDLRQILPEATKLLLFFFSTIAITAIHRKYKSPLNN